MELLTKTISRYLFAIPFLIFGLIQLIMAGNMVSMVPEFIPGGIFWVYATGLGFIGAALSILLQKMVKPATLLLGIMLIIFAFSVWFPQTMSSDQMTMQVGMTNFLKDLALAGAALFISGKS